MNSAPSNMNSAATETSDEIKNRAECTALRAITVKSPAMIAAIENTQKKTDSQPDKIIADCQLPIADCASAFLLAPANERPRFAMKQIFWLALQPLLVATLLDFALKARLPRSLPSNRRSRLLPLHKSRSSPRILPLSAPDEPPDNSRLPKYQLEPIGRRSLCLRP